MLTTELFTQILLDPASRCDELVVVSGYVSSPMALRHVFGRWTDGKRTNGLPDHCRVTVLYGMYPLAGIAVQDHKMFCSLMEASRRLSVGYCLDTPVHAKVYTWLKEGVPEVAYVGSANYTLTGFESAQVECCTEADPRWAHAFFCHTLEQSQIATEIVKPRFQREAFKGADDSTFSFDLAVEDLPCVRLPLFAVKEDRIQRRAGLNWGQRPGRDKNQAYVHIPAEIAKSGFFPKKGEPFTVLTDDDECFECVVAQDGDKGLETPASNAILGAYFRRRLGLASGEFVELDHLDQYGSRWITMYRGTENRFFLRYASE